MLSTTPTKKQIFLAVLLLFWMAGIVSAFYIFHKPLSAAGMERFQNMWIDLVSAAGIVFVTGGVGWRISAWTLRDGWERLAIASAFGFGVLGLVMLGLASIGWAIGPVVAFFLCSAAVLFFRDGIHWARSFREGWRFEGIFSWVCLAFVLISFAVTLGTALAPPITWDALVYHLRIPQEFLAARSMALPDSSIFNQFPLQGEMIFTAALALTGRGETAAVLGWWAGVLALIGITGTASRMGVRHPILAAAILLAGDSFARELGWAYVDWFMAFFGWAAVAILSGGPLTGRRLFLTGLLAGFAASTKYTSAALVGAILLWLLFNREARSRFLRNSMALWAGFLLVCIPWALKNVPLCGLPWLCIPDWRLRFFSGMPMPGAVWTVWIFPLFQSIAGTDGTILFGMTIGPLLVIFLPGALFRHEEKNPFPFSLLWSCGGFFWVITGLGAFFSNAITQPRLFMALLIPVALLAAYGFDGFFRFRLGQIRLGAIAGTLALMVMILQTIGLCTLWAGNGVPGYLAGAIDREAYVETNLGWYAPAMERVRQLPSGSKTLLLWEPRGYYCDTSCQEDANIDIWYGLMREGKTADQVIQEWKQNGITHILINDTGAAFERAGRPEYSTAAWAELDRLRGLLFAEKQFSSAYSLYRVTP
jgi:hypothetical protein